MSGPRSITFGLDYGALIEAEPDRGTSHLRWLVETRLIPFTDCYIGPHDTLVSLEVVVSAYNSAEDLHNLLYLAHLPALKELTVEIVFDREINPHDNDNGLLFEFYEPKDAQRVLSDFMLHGLESLRFRFIGPESYMGRKCRILNWSMFQRVFKIYDGSNVLDYELGTYISYYPKVPEGIWALIKQDVLS
jgi:hypothetical protein